ncbi:FxLYD domain-containing protein [Sorangium sp. So ce134]
MNRQDAKTPRKPGRESHLGGSKSCISGSFDPFVALAARAKLLELSRVLDAHRIALAGDELGVVAFGPERARRFCRLTDGSGVIIPCIAREIAMTGPTNLPDDIAIEELGYLLHRFPAFTAGVEPVDAITLGEVETVSRGAESAHTGTLDNALDVAVSDPKVTVFPVNRVGRPLGAATSSAAAAIPPGGTWTFETTTADDPGVDHVAYPTDSFPPRVDASTVSPSSPTTRAMRAAGRPSRGSRTLARRREGRRAPQRTSAPRRAASQKSWRGERK